MLLDDAAGQGVGDGALEAVADFQAQLAVRHEREQDRAVVDPLSPHPPGGRRPDREVLEAGGRELGKIET